MEEQANAENTYVMDPESASEMGRLLLQDKLINDAMGGYFPERTDLEGVRRILDIGCGPGGWALGVAKRYPHIQITGIDVSQRMIAFAQVQAMREGHKNARFEVMNALTALDFPDASFDLVNIRTAIGWIPRERWPDVLRECSRVTRAGGTIRLSECEGGSTNKPANDKWGELLIRFLQQKGYGFSMNGTNHGIACMLGKLLLDAGCLPVSKDWNAVNSHACYIDFSYRTPLHAVQFQNFLVLYKEIQPLYVQMGLARQEELNRLYVQFQEEMQSEDFRAGMCWLTFWAEKP